MEQQQPTTDQTASTSGGIAIDDDTAMKVIRMAKKFYSDPENVRKYNEWLKESGSLPNDGKKDGK